MSNTQRLTRLVAILVLALIFAWLSGSTTATAITQLVGCSPLIPKEIPAVEPVTSPTTLLTQTLTVRLTNGHRVTVTSEAGTTIFTVASATVFVSPIALQPNVTHHIVVTGEVEDQPGCYYPTQSRAIDNNGAPLTIIQLGRRIYLPIVLKH
jgi:hypothetical protein